MLKTNIYQKQDEYFENTLLYDDQDIKSKS